MFTGLIRAFGVLERAEGVSSGRRFRARVRAPGADHATED